MQHHKLIKNPIFKIVGIGVILYFALFANKYDNRSLSRRYSVDNIKKSVVDAIDQQKEIQDKISKAKKEKSKFETEIIENEKK